MAVGRSDVADDPVGFDVPDPDEFRPTGVFCNRHLQSVLASLRIRSAMVRRRAAPLLQSSVDMVLECGDGVRLAGAHSAAPGEQRPLVVLIHGWEGSADSLYLVSLGARLFAAGYDIFRLNLRDHGNTHHLNRELFHSCRLSDATGALRALARRFPGRPLMLAGYSLGGNFALRVGLNAPAEGVDLNAVLAVSPVLDPRRTLAALESGWPIYRYYFMRKWRRSLLRKAELFPDAYDFSDIHELESLTAMTAFFVERYTGYPSLEEYFLGYALIGDRLRGLSVPSLLIAAEDDPIIPAADLDSLDRGSALRVLRSRHGGHCGFFDGWRLSSWVEDRAVDLFDSRKAALAGQGGNA